MNEIQIIQKQLSTERQHFSEVAAACVAELQAGRFASGGDFARACAEYFAYAVTRFAGSGPAPNADASQARWREFVQTFTATSRSHFEALDALDARNPLVTEWRAVSRIDADSIFAERALYGRFKATSP